MNWGWWIGAGAIVAVGAAVLWAVGWLACLARMRGDDPARHTEADRRGIIPEDMVEVGGRWFPKPGARRQIVGWDDPRTGMAWLGDATQVALAWWEAEGAIRAMLDATKRADPAGSYTAVEKALLILHTWKTLGGAR